MFDVRKKMIGLNKTAAMICMVAMATFPLAAETAKGTGSQKKKNTATRATIARQPAASHGTSSKKASGKKKSASHGAGSSGKASSKTKGKGKHRAKDAAPTPESRRLTSAFTASAQLRPMAQQLVATRTAAAYAGVAAYAAAHTGEASAAAQLALGHAYALDRKYPEAQAAFRDAASRGQSLSDYADYLGAQAAFQANRGSDAAALLDRFAERHPESIFITQVPILLANALMQQGNGQGAVAVLTPLLATPAASKTDVRYALGKAYQMVGSATQAADLYRGIYLNNPLSFEAAGAKTQLQAMNIPLSAADHKQHADALFNAKHYSEAQQEYRGLQKNDAALTPADRDALEIYAAVCDLRLKKLARGDVDRLPVTTDDSAALKLYLQSELRRNANDYDGHDALIAQMLERYPHSRWLEEALYSGGNMYTVKHDAARAIVDYTLLVKQFPTSTYAPSAHWRAAWLSYRQRRYPDAAKLMDEQISMYPAGNEIPGALYWRGRLYEDVEQNFGQALNYYAAINSSYVNSYYASLARQRIATLGKHAVSEASPVLASVRSVDTPPLTAELPENDVHLIKARLLANAALNEYIRPEIQASPTSSEWGALAQAEIYQSYGENTRALQAMKQSGLPFFSLAVADVPHIYWQLLFPRPYWEQLEGDAQRNGLDPYLVASLIRQESEFNPGAVSRANAYGLMQLLPSTGKSEAKQAGIKKFTTNMLLNPITNLQLGTADLRQSLSRYGGQVEYALASYNAGDTPVRQWIALNDYKDIPEWVESIPYTETREYVQAIVRNKEMYKSIYQGK